MSLRRILGGAVLCLVAVTGCGQSPPPASDPAVGRETLRNALDAWKRGETPESYKQTSSGVTVADRQWRQGVKLLDYEIDGDGQPDGYDVQYKVKLSIQDGLGKQARPKAVYNVSTSPALVIVRLESGG